MPDPPELDEPKLSMPADLDLVLRIDVAKLRGTLGADFRSALEALLRSAPAAAPDAATQRLLLALLARSETAWIGVRPGLSPELTDNVLILRGDFSAVFPRALGGEPPWGHPRDLGGGVVRFERPAPPLRVAPAVLYFRAPDVAILGSYAEVDALERTVESGRGDPPLEPPDTGIASLAARLHQLRADLRKRSPRLAELLSGAETLTASGSFTGSALDVRAELRFDSSERARSAADALGALARLFASRDRSWLGEGEFSAVERFMTVRLRVPAADLARALGRLSAPDRLSGGTVPPP